MGEITRGREGAEGIYSMYILWGGEVGIGPI